MSDITNKVLAVSKPYMGPAAEAFLARQCKLFLKIDMGALASSHLKDLANCFETGARAIMDPAKSTELAKKIAAL